MEVQIDNGSMVYSGIYRKPKGKHNPRVVAFDGAFSCLCTCGFSLTGVDRAEAEYAAAHHHEKGFEKPVRSQVLFTSKGEEVEVKFDDARAREILGSMSWSNFATDLARGYDQYKGWTAGQRPWAHKLAQEHLAREAQRAAPVAPVAEGPGPFLRIIEVLDRAAGELKHPKLRYATEEGEIVLSRAGGRSRTPGAVNLTSEGSFDDRAWYGRVERDGSFRAGRNVPAWVLGALEAIAEDPEGACRTSGQRFGRCSCCGRELTNAESIALGIGPICREKWFGA